MRCRGVLSKRCPVQASTRAFLNSQAPVLSSHHSYPDAFRRPISRNPRPWHLLSGSRLPDIKLRAVVPLGHRAVHPYELDSPTRHVG